MYWHPDIDLIAGVVFVLAGIFVLFVGGMVACGVMWALS